MNTSNKNKSKHRSRVSKKARDSGSESSMDMEESAECSIIGVNANKTAISQGLARSSSVNSMRSNLSEASASAKKRKLEASGTEPEKGSVTEDDMTTIRMIGEKLRGFVFKDANKISKIASEFILTRVSEYEECIMKMVCKNERLIGRLEECERVRASGPPLSRTYANAVTSDSKGKEKAKEVRENEVKTTSYAAVVRMKDENMKTSSKEVKKKIMREVSKVLDVRVKAVRMTRSGAVAIETVSERELNKIRKCEKFDAIGMKVDLPRKVGPKLIIYDVPNEMANDAFMNEVYERNLKHRMTESEFQVRTRIVSRKSKKGETNGNIILETSMSAKNTLTEEGRVYVEWNAFKVKEFVSVTRCYGCFAFGHMLKECSEKGRLCQKCGEAGHMMKECKKMNECRNCKLRGMASDHSVLFEKCPEYVRALIRMKERISND